MYAPKLEEATGTQARSSCETAICALAPKLEDSAKGRSKRSLINKAENKATGCCDKGTRPTPSALEEARTSASEPLVRACTHTQTDKLPDLCE